ncbi:MAG: cbb3-type cytochrome c oxidase subunit I [Phycisphaerales bacterium]|nr:cbb3-type cytochrome c oxidase subunit I [Phycisphaerales bacterium]
MSGTMKRAFGRGGLLLAGLPIACLLGVVAVGLVVGVKAAFPEWMMDLLPMQVLQPLHAFMGVAFVLCGLASGVVIALRRECGGFRGDGLVAPAMFVFVVGSGAAIVLGRGSGVEYIGWPVGMSVFLGLVFLGLAGAVLSRLSALSARTPEGAWLLVIGLVLVAMGLGERSAEIIARPDLTRSLTIEWHALDTFFAGWNAALYGLGMVAIMRPGDQGRRLRGRWLFVLAVFCLLSTFSHHHYMSAQPSVLKWIALTASMLAAVSFARHVWAIAMSWSRHRGGPPERAFFIAAEVWTLVAVGTGILLAVPQLNIWLHGTTAIVSHSMGSMIGVNVMIVMGTLVRYGCPCDAVLAQQMIRRVRWTGVTLVLVCVNLVLAGGVEGVLRVDRTFQEWDPAVRQWLSPLPVLGVLLGLTLTSMCVGVWRSLRTGEQPERRAARAAIEIKPVRMSERVPVGAGTGQ